MGYRPRNHETLTENAQTISKIENTVSALTRQHRDTLRPLRLELAARRKQYARQCAAFQGTSAFIEKCKAYRETYGDDFDYQKFLASEIAALKP
jgi:hypothetical protein